MGGVWGLGFGAQQHDLSICRKGLASCLFQVEGIVQGLGEESRTNCIFKAQGFRIATFWFDNLSKEQEERAFKARLGILPILLLALGFE